MRCLAGWLILVAVATGPGVKNATGQRLSQSPDPVRSAAESPALVPVDRSEDASSSRLPTGATAFFKSLVARTDAIQAISYRSQAEIKRGTVNLAKGVDRTNNENVIYDPANDAARLEFTKQISLYNRVQLKFPEKKSGQIAFIWDYRPGEDWNQNNSTVNTHKMFMIGNWDANDRRMLEQRFHYARGGRPGAWQVDTRSYGVGAKLDGVGRGLDRVTPWSAQFARVGEWNRFYADIDFEAVPFPVYSLRMRSASDGLVTIYDKVVLSDIITSKGGVNFFDPTWVNTSQGANSRALVHGWLRNAVVLWDEKQLDGLPSIWAVELNTK